KRPPTFLILTILLFKEVVQLSVDGPIFHTKISNLPHLYPTNHPPISHTHFIQLISPNKKRAKFEILLSSIKVMLHFLLLL
ncbi:hypothetical protein, partial [Mammaliicoccus sciuri]|uniref:hypothetical protein n=1 Tax=Mammaliicoccus sciuri TaxID=1296 RepID=UPI0028864CD2